MTRITSAILSIYIASLLYLSVPFVKTLIVMGKGAAPLFWNHLAIFVIFFVLAFFALSKHIASYGSPIPTTLAALLLAGLVIAIFYQVVPLAPIYEMPSFLNPYFATDAAFTAWLIGPLVALIFL